MKAPTDHTTNLKHLASQVMDNVNFESIKDVTDIVVIGGGLAGLAAAKQLSDQNRYHFKLLEAKSRVGGRTLNQQLTTTGGERHIVDGGAQWVGATHIHMQSLIAELGLSTFTTPQEGEPISQDDLPAQVQSELATIRATLNRLAASLPIHAPWLAQSAQAWDGITAYDWCVGQGYSATAIEELDYSVRSFLAAPIAQISFLFLLHYIRSAGSIEQLEVITGGAQDRIIKEGAQSICLALQQQLAEHVQFDAVTKVEDHGEFCLVSCQSGQVILCQRVIFAMAPSLLGNIQFEPPLLSNKRQLIEQWDTSEGSIKAHLLYTRPFWRAQGLSGISFIPNEVLTSTFDCSRNSNGPGLLTVFVNSSDAMRALSLDERKEQVLAVLSQFFGNEAFEAVDYVETDWQAVPYQRGCESPLAVGKLTQFADNLKKPLGSFHFCGTETADIWTGYMEGAVASGYRAAEEAAQALDHQLFSL